MEVLKNIIVLSYYYEPDLCAGSFRTVALVEQLIKKIGDDVNVTVITTMPTRYSNYRVDASQLEIKHRITIHRVALPSHKQGIISQAICFVHFAWGACVIAKNIEACLVYATSSRLMTAALGATISQMKSAPLFLDIRDLFVDTLADLQPRWLFRPLLPIFGLVEKCTFLRSTIVNIVSDGFRPYLKKKFPALNLTVHTNGIDEQFLACSPPAKFSSQSEPIDVLYAGNIGDGQGLEKILPGLAKALGNSISFRVIGGGSARHKLERLIDINGINNISLFPPVSRRQLMKEYERADILFLHLNHGRAFEKVLPSKIFEYGALGKPILAGVNGYARAFIEQNLPCAQVFKPCDAQSAKVAFDKLSLVEWSNEEFRKRYRRTSIMSRLADEVLMVCK